MIIEKFCASDESPDLFTMLNNSENITQEDFIKEIEDKLEVRSFDEFVEKFMPSVWEWYEASGDPSNPVEFRYSLEKPIENRQVHELKLSNNDFYKMVMDLYSKKSMSGKSNLEFDYSLVAELLAPSQVQKNAKQIRKDLAYNYNKLLKLEENAKSERNECIRRIKSLRKEIVEQYTESLTGKVKLALADIEKKLEALPEQKKSEESENGSKALPCKVQFDDNGDLEVIQIKINENEILTEKQTKNELAEIVANDFDKYGEEKSEYFRNLIVDNYVGGGEIVPSLDRTELIRKRDSLTRCYKNSQEQFIRAISSAVEKMLDVKAFFEQASRAGKKLPAPVIITNCKASKLVENQVRDKFRNLIQMFGKQVSVSRVWFAVVPAIGDEDLVDNPDIEEKLDDDLDIGEEDTNRNDIKTTDGDSLISMGTMNQILDILKSGKITTFFNFRANETTGFAKFNEDILDKYRIKVKGAGVDNNDYAVFVYPNFTVLPKKKTCIEIGSVSYASGDKKEYLDIPGIYIDSSYVAAGLTVASQNPDYLADRGYKVDKDNPCVRFDIEEGENRFIMQTNMNREGKCEWSSDIENNIGKDMFGFCFCGNTKYYKDNRVNHTYVYVARTMKKDKGGSFKKLYTRLTIDYITQYLQISNGSIGNKISKNDIEQFMRDKVERWKRVAESDKGIVNNILHKNDDVSLDENKLHVRFNRDEELIPLEIEED